MDLKCFCGLRFTDLDQLYQHATSQGHRIKCSSGKLLGTDTQLKIHQRTFQHGWKYEKLKALHGLPGIERSTQSHHERSNAALLSSAPAVSYACNFCNKKLFKDAEALDQH